MTKQKRTIRIEGDIAIVPLTKGYEAIIDIIDIPLIEKYNWYANVDKNGRLVYAVRSEFGEKIKMHREILGLSNIDPINVDHRDTNTLNNRRYNLRLCNEAQNRWNSKKVRSKTGYKGVFPDAQGYGYGASVMAYGIRESLGYYKTPEEAAKAYDKRARELHGEFAVLNFPKGNKND